MYFGSPYASGYGDPNHMVAYAYFEAARLAKSRLFLVFKARANYGNAWFSVYINDMFCGNFYATEGQQVQTAVAPPAFATTCVVTIIRIGHYGDPGYNIARVARQMETGESPMVSWQWTWKPTYAAVDGDGQQTSSWSLTGVTRKNTTTVTGNNYWGQLSVDHVISGATDTINIYNRTVLIATGSGTTSASPQTITIVAVAPLVPDGSLGINGTMVLAGGATAWTGAILYYKWPASMNILRDTFSPPTTVRANVLFNKQDRGQWTEPAALTAGTYYYQIQEVSDDGIAGTACATQTEIVNGPPASIANLRFVSES